MLQINPCPNPVSQVLPTSTLHRLNAQEKDGRTLAHLLPPSNNPPSVCRCRTFPSLLKARAPNSHRSLYTRLGPNIMPLNWRTPPPSQPVCTHLPMDALAHLTLWLLSGLSYTPLINSTLLPDLPPLPSDEIIVNAYRALRRKVRSLMMNHPPTPRVLLIPTSTIICPSIHGPWEVHCRAHPSDACPEELPGCPPLLVQC